MRNKTESLVDENLEAGPERKDVMKECLRSLVFTMVRLISKLPLDNYNMIKYFLSAILDSTKNLKNQLKYIIKIPSIMEFLESVLDDSGKSSYKFDFNNQS